MPLLRDFSLRKREFRHEHSSLQLKAGIVGLERTIDRIFLVGEYYHMETLQINLKEPLKKQLAEFHVSATVYNSDDRMLFGAVLSVKGSADICTTFL